MTATFITLSVRSLSLFLTNSLGASVITHCSALLTFTCPVPRRPRNYFSPAPCVQPAVAPTILPLGHASAVNWWLCMSVYKIRHGYTSLSVLSLRSNLTSWQWNIAVVSWGLLDLVWLLNLLYVHAVALCAVHPRLTLPADKEGVADHLVSWCVVDPTRAHFHAVLQLVCILLECLIAALKQFWTNWSVHEVRFLQRWQISYNCSSTLWMLGGCASNFSATMSQIVKLDETDYHCDFACQFWPAVDFVVTPMVE